MVDRAFTISGRLFRETIDDLVLNSFCETVIGLQVFECETFDLRSALALFSERATADDQFCFEIEANHSLT